MLRYVIAFGRSGSEEETGILNTIRLRLAASTDSWCHVLAESNLLATYVVSSSAQTVPPTLHGRRGVVFGSMYPTLKSLDRSNLGPVSTLSEEQSGTILRSQGGSLTSNFWGHYVAVLRYPDAASIIVVRSPVSPLPCLHLRVGTVSVFFSYIPDCLMLGLTALSINWDSVTAQVVGGDYLTSETGINEIGSLDCGQAMICASSGDATQSYWRPNDFLQNRQTQQFTETVRNFRETTERCVHAHASSHERILVSLSGGLDSSIILSTLTRAPHEPSLAAVTYYSRGCGDERRFARSMAQTAACPLLEHARNDQLDLRRFNDCNLTVQPVLNFSAPDAEARNMAEARKLRVSAIFNGELGDNIFGNNPSPGTLTECFRHNGPGGIFLRAISDYSMLTRQSVWRTLSLWRREQGYVAHHPDFSVSQEMRRRYGKEKAESMMLASSAAQEHYDGMADRFLHPWLRGSRRLAPGSHTLIYGLIVVTSTAYHSPFSAPDDPLQISPLISQPLVELALQTPSHLHFENGQDRAVARTAFSDVLPATILQRGLGKGGPNLWAKDVIDNNAAFLKEFLLDGILVHRNLADRKKVEAALSPKIAKSTAIVGDIFAKLYIESWLRKAKSSVGRSLLGTVS
jgi:asparagine synthase (glutamine-hydrolysing)